jgi:hypothetical protein
MFLFFNECNFVGWVYCSGISICADLSSRFAFVLCNSFFSKFKMEIQYYLCFKKEHNFNYV